jgi:Flp pilus assembly protein TadD
MYAPHLNRGRALMRQKRPDEAMADFNRAVELNPQMGEIYYFRGLCYAAKGNNAQAQQDIQKSKALGYNPPPQNAPNP